MFISNISHPVSGAVPYMQIKSPLQENDNSLIEIIGHLRAPLCFIYTCCIKS